uniref:Peptidase M50 n=1 Tax=Cyanothece sp. (strain PCC 7425 / ATCC 29141) TaxID=395961 RepID=B8HQ27_CYAP4
MVWLSLFLLGLILLLIVRQSVARVTRTPWWLLWLVLMLPALLIGYWVITQGKQPPFPLLASFFLFSTLLYFFLVQRGRITPSPSNGNGATPLAETPLAPEAPPPATRLIDKAEESQLRSCFPWSVFYLQDIEPGPQVVICRGQLRSQPDAAYQTIKDNIAAHFGDRFLVIFQMGASNKPFFALITNPQRLKSTAKLTRPLLALGLMALTLLTTTLAGVELADPQITAQALKANPSLVLLGIPYAVALMTILGIHELGHYLTARFYQIRATLPYFIPVPFAIGTMGAFIQMRSPIPNRKTLFDVGIAGPLAGFIVTIPFLIWGLFHSEVVPLPEKTTPLNFDAFNPNFSLLMILLSKLVLGAQLNAQSGIDLHPVAIAGCLGLVVTALNLMPVGQLDGGHIVHAMFGQRVGAAIGQITRLLVLLLCLVQPWLWFWAIILFFLPAFDEPALNDVSELDNQRDFLGLLSLTLLLLIVLPAPDFLTNLLLSATNPAP